jgi:glycosyltransferase involved in cell wall biosynthesis
MGEYLRGADGSGRQPTLSVFFPCYDDAPTIGVQVERVDAVMDRLGVDGEIIVVDDGSRDASPDVLESLRASMPRLRVVTHKQNRGYGAALQSGFGAASGEWIFYTDGDGQYDPA